MLHSCTSNKLFLLFRSWTQANIRFLRSSYTILVQYSWHDRVALFADLFGVLVFFESVKFQIEKWLCEMTVISAQTTSTVILGQTWGWPLLQKMAWPFQNQAWLPISRTLRSTQLQKQQRQSWVVWHRGGAVQKPQSCAVAIRARLNDLRQGAGAIKR